MTTTTSGTTTPTAATPDPIRGSRSTIGEWTEARWISELSPDAFMHGGRHSMERTVELTIGETRALPAPDWRREAAVAFVTAGVEREIARILPADPAVRVAVENTAVAVRMAVDVVARIGDGRGRLGPCRETSPASAGGRVEQAVAAVNAAQEAGTSAAEAVAVWSEVETWAHAHVGDEPLALALGDRKGEDRWYSELGGVVSDAAAAIAERACWCKIVETLIRRRFADLISVTFSNEHGEWPEPAPVHAPRDRPTPPEPSVAEQPAGQEQATA